MNAREIMEMGLTSGLRLALEQASGVELVVGTEEIHRVDSGCCVLAKSPDGKIVSAILSDDPTDENAWVVTDLEVISACDV